MWYFFEIIYKLQPSSTYFMCLAWTFIYSSTLSQSLEKVRSRNMVPCDYTLIGFQNYQWDLVGTFKSTEFGSQPDLKLNVFV